MENNKIRQEMIVEDVFDSLKEMKEEIDSALGLADEMKKDVHGTVGHLRGDYA